MLRIFQLPQGMLDILFKDTEVPPVPSEPVPVCAPEQIPRPEYPRPQFVRDAWMNLNGTWEFRTDDESAGLAQSWFSSPDEFPDRILVPLSFESIRSGIADRAFHSSLRHRRSF